MAGFNPATWPTFNQNPLTQSLASAQAFNHNNLTNQGLRFNNDHANEMLRLKEFIASNSARNAKNAESNIALQYEKLRPQQVNAAVRMSQDPLFQKYASENPEAAAKMLQAYAGYTNTFDKTQNNPMPSVGGGVGQYFTPGGSQAQNYQGQPGMQTPMMQPQMTQAQVPPQQPAPPQAMHPSMMQAQNTPGQSMYPQMTQHPMMQSQNGTPSVSPQQVAAAQDATASALIKKTTPEAVLRQRYYNKSITPILDKIRKELPVASKYFGYAGGANAAGNKVLMGLGVNPNSDYLQYQNLLQDYQNLANESKRALGGQASDQEQKVIDLFSKPDLVHSTKESALNNLNNLQNLFGIVDRTANLSPAQVSRTESPTSSGSPPLSGRPKVGTSSIPPQSKNTNAVFVDSVPPGHIAMIDKKGQPRVILSDHEKDAMALGWRRKYG